MRPERSLIEEFDFDERTLHLIEQSQQSAKKRDEKAFLRQLKRSKDVVRLIDEAREGPACDFLLLIDRIDDTWNRSEASVTLLMALMHACVELAASSSTVRPLLFLRENLFQRVRQVDTEFTRLETAVVSLDWTAELLIEMIERRLQIDINPKPPIGETWDHFFEDDGGGSTKNEILWFCQHRPRDLLIYCSFAIEERNRTATRRLRPRTLHQRGAVSR